MDRGEGRTKYLLTGEGAGTVFVIDEATGNIHVTKSLDREEKAQYVLLAQAVDRASNRPLEPPSEYIIKVQDINDNPPIFPLGPYHATVPEMSNVGEYPKSERPDPPTSWSALSSPSPIAFCPRTQSSDSLLLMSGFPSSDIPLPALPLLSGVLGSPTGTSVIQVTAHDADDPSYGNSAKLVYTVLDGLPFFSVDPQTGEGRVQERWGSHRNRNPLTQSLSLGVVRTAIPNMDRETQEEFLVVIQAKDMGGHMGGLSGSTTVTVTLSDVNDNPPKFPQSKRPLLLPGPAFDHPPHPSPSQAPEEGGAGGRRAGDLSKNVSPPSTLKACTSSP